MCLQVCIDIANQCGLARIEPGFDRNDLMQNYYQRVRGEKAVVMSLSASPPGKNVSYFASSNQGAEGHLTVHSVDEEHRWLKRNCTHFVKIIIPRTPGTQVFRLKQA